VIAIAEVPLKPEGGPIVVVGLRKPGFVRGAVINLQRKLLSTAAGGPEQFDEELVLHVECDPNGPMVNRKFLVMQPSQVYTPRDGVRAVYAAGARSPATDQTFHIFELLQADA
jgi:hypothetical protein